MSLKTIDKNIKTITTNAAKLNKLIHETAMLIMSHAKEHGDCSRALTLANAMPASMRRTMLVAWFEKYSPVRIVQANNRVGILKATAKNYVEWNLEGAAEEPFYDLAETIPEKAALDFQALLVMVQKLSKTIEKKIEDGGVVDSDVESAKALARAVAGLKVNRVHKDDKPVTQDNTTALAAEVLSAAA